MIGRLRYVFFERTRLVDLYDLKASDWLFEVYIF